MLKHKEVLPNLMLLRRIFFCFALTGKQEESPDLVTGILQVFSISVYSLLDLDATLSFVTPQVVKKLKVLHDILIEPFYVTTSMGDSVVAERVFMSPLYFTNRVMWVDLVKLDMVIFYVILGMDWSNACFASIDCQTRLIKFNLPNEPI